MRIDDPIKSRIDDIIKANPECKQEQFNWAVNTNNFDRMAWKVKFTEDGKNLLKSAIKELNFSEKELNDFEDILIGIMRLEKSGFAEACYVAEAIQYVNPRGTKQ